MTGCLVAVARGRWRDGTAPLHGARQLVLLDPLFEPIAALPLQVYVYALGPYEEWHRQAWAGALVLILMVLILGTVARVAARLAESQC